MTRPTLTSLLLLLLSACPRMTPIEPTRGPLKLDVPRYSLSDLPGEGATQYRDILGTIASPCEAPETLLLAAQEKRCPEAIYLSRIAYRLVKLQAGGASQVSDYLIRLEDTRQANAGQTLPLDLSKAPARGPEGAKVSVVEFADFECPHCKVLHDELEPLWPSLDQSVRFSFKNFPLSQHLNAEPAARAALAAGKQGKFWEYSDLLFSRQDQIAPDKFNQWARELDLDIDQFAADYTSGSISRQVAFDRDEALGMGVNTTPTLVIDGQPYLDFKARESIWDAILFALAAKGVIPLPEPPQ